MFVGLEIHEGADLVALVPLEGLHAHPEEVGAPEAGLAAVDGRVGQHVLVLTVADALWKGARVFRLLAAD